ncbi:MAG TPA: hypothetical protein VLW17_11435 [Thermoanaerobaculaceae bacterium]|nr:hypothetical protein [Thermoanaerobaculaceae bacterium]
MPRSCSLTRAGLASPAEWSLDDETLVVAPDGAPPEACPVREIAGIGGDDYTLEVKLADGGFTLGKLGADGSTLQERLRRLWLPQRAAALRLAGTGDPQPYSGAVGPAGAGRPFRGLLFDDLLAFAPDGADVEPLFLPLVKAVTFDESGYVVRVQPWDGGAVEFARLAGRTEEFARGLRDRRGALAAAASRVLAAHLPALGPASLAALAAVWLAGRVLSTADLDRSARGAADAALASWAAALPRRAEADALRRWAAGTVFLGYSRADALGAAPETSAEPSPTEKTGTSGEEGAAASGAPPDALLWLLAARGDAWLLEELTVGDHATYRFQAGPELPELVSRLLCAPQFSREALYLPLEKLVAARSELAIAARELPFLAALRQRFRSRILHGGAKAWQDAISRVG